MREVIKKQRVQLGEDAPEAAGPCGGLARRSRRRPGVQLVRVDGRVHAIELTCRCGEVSVVELEVDAPPEPPPAAAPQPCQEALR